MTTRRGFLGTGLAAAGRAQSRPRRPNILLIMADDLGATDLSCYQAPDIRTPNIDSLAGGGVRFTCAYANAPECSPTRTGLLTGRYQQRVGGLECAIGVGNVGRYDEAQWLQRRGELGLPTTETSIARMLRDAGYATACIGKWHLGYGAQFSANAHGFDEYFGILGGNADYYTHCEEDGTNVLNHNGRPVSEEGHLTDLITSHAARWLERTARTDKPWFLYVPYTAPHLPLQALGDGPVRDKSKWNAGTRATYVRMVEQMDGGIGELLAALRRTGSETDTLVVFKSDNGGYQKSNNHPFRGFKSSVFEGGLRIPLLMRWPAAIPRATTAAQVAISMDVTATALAAAGVKPSRALDGMNLLPVLAGGGRAVERTLYWSYKRAQQRRWAVRDGQWKYIIDNGNEYLYNLALDEAEKIDLREAEPLRFTRMRSLLAEWKRETAAPRLKEFRPGPA
ncbi:MAG: sulfatase-like hydrolase/transferase [Bryobacterales bacterium]|nr:sulfatase-like hydrolase/transferase [Bryobacterales bacterium]